MAPPSKRCLMKTIERNQMTSITHIMTPYTQLGKLILEKGHIHGDRTGHGRKSLYGHQLRFDLNGNAMPVDSSRSIAVKSACNEILWMLAGCTDVSILKQMRCNFWDKWCYNLSTPEQKAFLKSKTSSLQYVDNIGPMYGRIWRGKNSLTELFNNTKNDDEDQLAFVLATFAKSHNSARMRMTAWNPNLIPKDESIEPWQNVAKGGASLTPCHGDVQFLFRKDEETQKLKLTVVMFQRSADYMLGVPHNIAQYAFLAHWLAFVTGTEAEELVINYGDVHIYVPHLEDAAAQFEAGQVEESKPTLKLVETDHLIKLRNKIHYFSHPEEWGKNNHRVQASIEVDLKDYFGITIAKSMKKNVFDINGYMPSDTQYKYAAAV